MMDLLFSYYFLRNNSVWEDIVLANISRWNVLIDSGAFSAFHSGEELDIKVYTNHCLTKYHNKVWQYIMLDKLMDEEQSRANLDYMVDAGCKPMPVFTANEEWAYISKCVQVNPHVCMSGGPSNTDQYVRYRYQRAFRESGGKAKIHALGFLRFPDIYQLPLFSGDSASFADSARYGNIPGYNIHRGVYSMIKSTKAAMKDPRKTLQSLNPRDRDYIAGCGIDFTKAAKEGQFSNSSAISPVAFMSINAYLSYSYDARKHYDRLVFLAVSTVNWLFGIVAVQHTKNGIHFNYGRSVEVYKNMMTLYKAKKVDKLVEYIGVL